ncbi:hypothetical protein [Sphingobium lignivorans]|uniref:Uncharacterized protein n=1 Tax=Sphingobium lignivorans TaxID=2735886 RepID=A0ABR6NJ57_9SPHN|nr:hypothetical protein [Sphingobium lignivorans]MBB5987315.1 hypothetical protein [Sphingobium lignivorans]
MTLPTDATQTSPAAPASAIDAMMTLWTLPARLGLAAMQNGMAMATQMLPMALGAQKMLGQDAMGQEMMNQARGAAKVAAEGASAHVQKVAEAAEEQAARIDDKPGDTVPNPAALVS